MSIPATVAEFVSGHEDVSRRVARIQNATRALEAIVRDTPTGQSIPLPLRLALRDFHRELRTLETLRAARCAP